MILSPYVVPPRGSQFSGGLCAGLAYGHRDRQSQAFIQDSVFNVLVILVRFYRGLCHDDIFSYLISILSETEVKIHLCC